MHRIAKYFDPDGVVGSRMHGNERKILEGEVRLSKIVVKLLRVTLIIIQFSIDYKTFKSVCYY